MLREITYGTFIFFGVMTVVGGAFYQLFIPETNGKSLEDMDVLFEAKGLAWQQMRAFEEWKLEQLTLLGQEKDEGENKQAMSEEKEIASKV
jgi:hypothetical protein